MSNISLHGYSLRRNGAKKTLKQADDHNSRRISTEYGRYGKIDPTRTHLNLELISLNGRELEKVVDENLLRLGIDINHWRIKAKNRGLAIEVIISVTAGHQCDFNSLYKDCLSWLKLEIPECPILQAVIHHDENEPHMHVIFIPMLKGKLQGDKVKGFKGINRYRESKLLSYLNSKYGLKPMANLQKAHKKEGVKLALKLTKEILEESAISPLKAAIEMSIAARPEPFLYAMGITFKDFQEHLKNTHPFYVGDANDHS